MHRRELLRTAGSAALTLAAAPLLHARVAAKKRVLVFTRSAGFQHDCVKLNNGTCLVHETWKTLASKNDLEVECTKDGRIFQPDTLAKFDAFFFITTEDLTADKSEDGAPPMSKEGKAAFLNAIASGKGFMGSHCAADTFHSKGDRRKSQTPDEMDPYGLMLGGEFISHGPQQVAKMLVTSPGFPGLKETAEFSLNEEWYSLKNYSKDLHVILVQDTAGMKGVDYERPKFPATWARKHGKGRVFYTSMGHRDDVWTNPMFQDLLIGATNWTTGRVDTDISPNIDKVAPQAATMPPPPPPEKKKQLTY
jgi:uncharacterized protein